MTDKYSVTYDLEANRVDFTLSGVWRLEDALPWEHDYRSAVAAAGPGFTIVGDLTAYPPQAPRIEDFQGRLMKWSATQGMSRAVFIVPVAGPIGQIAQIARLRTQVGAEEAVALVASRDEAVRHLAA